jgi:hypothetical protein
MDRERIRQLKITLKEKKRFELFDPNVSERVRELVFNWREHYMCRHFVNGQQCYLPNNRCQRIHTVCGAENIKMDIDSIKKTGKAPFIDSLYDEMLVSRPLCLRLVYEIREYMYEVAIDEMRQSVPPPPYSAC